MPPGGKPARPAVHRNAFPVAGRCSRPASGACSKSKIQCNWRQTDPDGRRGCNPRTRSPLPIACGPVSSSPACFGHVGKRAIAVVVVQAVLPQVRDEEVIEAIVVVVADAHAVCPAGRLQPGLLGDIGEGAVAIVLVQPVRRLRRIAVQSCARQQKDIHPAIVVVIDECAAAAVGFENVLLRIRLPP